MGVSALASGSIQSVLKTYPKARIFFLDYAAEPAISVFSHDGRKTQVELVNIRFNKRLFRENHIFSLLILSSLARLLPSKWRNTLVSSNRYLKAIDQSDIILAVAGGDSFSDIYGVPRFIYVTLPMILALLLGKPLVLMPQTLGPLKNWFTGIIATQVLRRCTMTYARDSDSLDFGRRILGRKRALIDSCYDVGFLIKAQIRSERLPKWFECREDSVPLVGVNISGLLYAPACGYSQQKMFFLKADYPRLAKEIVEYFVKCGCRVMLTPHVFTDEKSESDLIASCEVYKGLPAEIRSDVFVLEGEFDQHEIKAIIGMCDFFLGSRMHACIAALSQCVPAVGLAYSRKFKGVFSSIGMDEMVVDLRNVDTDHVVGAIGSIFARRFIVKSELQRIIPSVHSSIYSILGSSFKDISRF